MAKKVARKGRLSRLVEGMAEAENSERVRRARGGVDPVPAELPAPPPPAPKAKGKAKHEPGQAMRIIIQLGGEGDGSATAE